MGKILLYNVNMMKADSIINVATSLGHEVIIVPKNLFGAPIGMVLMGLQGIKNNFKEVSIDDEMMIMAGLIGPELDKFIDAYNAAGIERILCKAVLTSTNSTFNARQLYLELKEHSKKMK